jgi:protein SCO1
MNSRRRDSRRFAWLLVGLGLFAAPALAHFPIPPKKGEVGKRAMQTVVPDFYLVDQDGNRFQFAKARGKLVLVTFIFTTCPDVCPFLTAKFAAVERALKEKKRTDYLLLSITTDPERDTPNVLRSYAERYNADFRHWLFLTGSRKELTKVWDGFGVAVRKSGGEIQHTALTTLIDPQGVRQFDYYTDKWEEREILKDIAAISPQRR